MAGLPVPSPAPISDADYEAIEAAVVETTRGRWFLTEYARRNRHAETQGLLDVLQRIEAKIDAPRHDPQLDRVRMSIMEMAQAIARTKDEIAAIKPTQEVEGRFGEATEELDAIVTTTETATDDILRAAEQIQEVAWTLRERGFEGPICDMLDERATDIYTACSFQDLTGQRTRKVIGVLRYLEARINAMIDIWGVEGGSGPRAEETAKAAAADDVPLGRKLAHGPARPGEGLDQGVVDTMLGPEETGADSADDAFAGLSIDDIMAAEVAEFVAVSVRDAEITTVEAVTEAGAHDDDAAEAEITTVEATAVEAAPEAVAREDAAAALDEPVTTEIVDIEAIVIDPIIADVATTAPLDAADIIAAEPRSFEIEARDALTQDAPAHDATADAVPQAHDAPPIASDLDLHIVDVLAPDVLDELVAIDVAETETTAEAEAAHEAAADPADAGAEHPIVPALPPIESSAARLSTADIDQLSPAERTALFT